MPKYDYDFAKYDIRIFVEWTEHGTWFNSLCEDFHDNLVKHTKEWGPPDIVEFRDKKDWLGIKRIIIEDGDIFDGNLDQFKTNFFTNAEAFEIEDWAKFHDWKCEIIYYA